ncbi:LysR family transcriptional regulator [Xenophilus arseniciresistens]|uniref:LysR family transcriptional regulator n=1 Tax=Xenophilus arseniciresistens TaxID=1283306 RepID=A0AAE3NBJ7_9BURK|nr:LysR family transcriptional regulator [Xenophilus arseniciresistens]MDA7417297.1 LysR family transcriptional regulator [Xenophilus arseniciresistens]
MDIRSVDLNLLVVFDTLMRTRSVNRSAEAIGLSQSATSGALARLRKTFDDALFVRTAATMEPTPRAQQLAPVVRRVVQTIQSEILLPPQFDPAQARRSFTILTPDIGEVAFLPGVLRRLQDEAPGVHLHAVSRPRAAAADALEKGEADLAVGYFPDLQKAGYFQQALFTSSYECITSADHEWAGRRVTLKQYLAARHVLVRPDGREHLLDSWLESRGWHRQVTLELSHFMSLIALLPGTNLVATVPQDIATAVGRHIPLQQIALPFKPPQLQVQQFWHRRMHNDAPNRWLRSLFYEVNRRDSGARLGY